MTNPKPDSLSSAHYIERYGLDANDRQIAREACRRVLTYRMFYLGHTGQIHGETFEGETAADYVNRMMGGASTKARVRILQTALAMALEEPGITLTTRTKQKLKKVRRENAEAA